MHLRIKEKHNKKPCKRDRDNAKKLNAPSLKDGNLKPNVIRGKKHDNIRLYG